MPLSTASAGDFSLKSVAAPAAPSGSAAANNADLAAVAAMQAAPGAAPSGTGPAPASPTGIPKLSTPPLPAAAPVKVDSTATPPTSPPPVPAAPADDTASDGFDAATSVEDPAERSEFSTTYNNTDGSHTVVSSLDRKNFLRDGNWTPVDNTLVQLPDGSVTNAANDWSVLFDNFGSGIALSTAAGVMGWKGQGAADVMPIIDPDGKSVRYVDAWPGVDVVYRVRGSAVEELLELKSSKAQASYAFDVQGAGLVADGQGGLKASGALGAAGLHVLPTVTYDASEIVVDSEANVTSSASPSVAGRGAVVPAVDAQRTRVARPLPNGRGVANVAAVPVADAAQTFSVNVDAGWLATQPANRFPVTIDPTIGVNPVPGLAHAYDPYGADVADGQARIGNPVQAGFPNKRWRSVFKWPYDAVPAGAATRVLNVEFLTYPTVGSGVHQMDFYHASSFSYNGYAEYLGSTTINAAAWGEYHAGGGTMISMYQSWIDVGQYGGALMMTSSECCDGGIYSLKQFYIDMFLTYDRAPNPATGLTVATNAGWPAYAVDKQVLNGTSPELAATALDPDGDSVQYHFYVYKNGSQYSTWDTLTGFVPSGTTARVSIPTYLTTEAGFFSWAVVALDGAQLQSVAYGPQFYTAHPGPVVPVPPQYAASTTPTLNFESFDPFDVPMMWGYQLCLATASCAWANGWSGWQSEGSHSANVTRKSFQLGLSPNTAYTLIPSVWDGSTYSGLGRTMRIATITPPSIASVSPSLPGGQLAASLRPTITASSFVDPYASQPDALAQSKFCLYDPNAAPTDGSCPLGESDWMASTGPLSWTPPAGLLQWGKDYGVYVQVRAGIRGNVLGGTPFGFTTRSVVQNRRLSTSLDPSTGVNMADGNFLQSATDAQVASPSDLLDVARSYNSTSTSAGSFGLGWSSFVDQHVVWDSFGSALWVYQADGSYEIHGRTAAGTWVKPGGSVSDVTDTGLPAGVSWRVVDANETKYDYDATGQLVKVVDGNGHGVTVSARNAAFVQTVTDIQSGRSVKYTWSGAGAGTTVVSVSTDPVGGQPLTWNYGYTGGLLTQVCDPRNNTLSTGKCVKYGYDAAQNLNAITKVGKTVPAINLTYVNDRVTSRQATNATPSTTTSTTSYSALTDVSVIVPGQTVAQTFKQATLTDPRGYTVVEQYDGSGRLVHRIDQAGKSDWWEYNTDGRLFKRTDRAGITESYEYDTDGNRTKKTDGLNKVWTYTYDNLHRRLTETDPLLNVVTYNHDTSTEQWFEEVVAPSTPDQTAVAQRTTRTEETRIAPNATVAYDPGNPTPGVMPAGLPRRTVDPLGRVTTMDYDAKGDLRRVTDPAGMTTSFTYDTLGRQLTKTLNWLDGAGAAQTATWTTTWTVLSQIATNTEPTVTNLAASPRASHQRRTTNTYDDNGNKQDIVESDLVGGDPSRTTHSFFDDLDREWKTLDAKGKQTVREFDLAGNVIKVTDPLGRVYQTTYDPRGLESQVTLTNYINPVVGGTGVSKVLKSATYTDLAKVDVETDALGRQVKHRYDALGREYQAELVTYVKPDGSTITPFVLNYQHFDDAGRVDREDKGNGMLRIDRTFDAAGRATTEKVTNTGSQDRLLTKHYDAASNVVSSTVTCPLACSLPAVQQRTVYDSAGRPVQGIVENGATDLVTVTQYDQRGNVVKVTDPRGTANPASPLAQYTTTYAYDAVGQATTTVLPSVSVDVKGASTVTVAPTVIDGYNTFGDATHHVDANGNRTITAYDLLSRKTSVAYPSYTAPAASPINPTETFGYDDVGNMTSRVDRLAQTWTFEFDSFNQPVRQTAPKPTPTDPNPVTLNGYDAVGNLLTTTDPSGAVVNYTYDNLNRKRTMSQVVRPVVAGDSAQTYVTKLDYDALGNQVYMQDPTGAITTQVFSPLGELLQRTLPASGAGVARTTFTYDLAGRTLVTTDPLGRSTTNTYDTAGRVTGIAQFAAPAAGGALLATSTIGYDQNSNQTSVTKPEGGVWNFNYDELNQLRSVVQPSTNGPSAWWKLDETAGTTAANTANAAQPGTFSGTYTLNQTGALSSTGKSVKFTAGNVSVPALAVRGSTKSYSLWFKTSSSGVLLSKSNTASGTTPTSFTPLIYVGSDGKLRAGTATTAQITTASSVANNSWHRVVFNITPDSQELFLDGTLVGSIAAATVVDTWATFAYVATGYTAGYTSTTGGWMPFNGSVDDVALGDQPLPLPSTGTGTAVQPAPAGTITTSFGYDKAGNQTKTVDGKGLTWWSTYNTWNLAESRVEPSATVSPVEAETNRTFTTTYNAAGLVASDIQPGGISITNQYDQLGRLKSQTGVGAAGSKAFTYDSVGRVVTSSHPTGTLTFGYDDRGLMRTATGPAGTSGFGYDGDGRVVTRTDPAGTSSFSYTPRGELYAVGDPATGKTVIHSYNDASQLTGINFDNNLATAATRTLTYDTTGRIATDAYKNGSGTVTSSLVYGYDRDNNMTSKVTGPTGIASNGTNRYYYDRAGRLIDWRRFDNTSIGYAYDNNGNRTNNGTVTSTYDQRNRILTNGTTTYNWSARGVLTSSVTGSTTTTYAFDAFGRMTGSGTVGFAYDALGRMATRTVGSTTTGFTYSGSGTDPTSDGTNTYTRTPSGDVLSVAQGATKLFAQLDQHGDVTATLTTAGAVSSSRAYDPYGVVTATVGTTSPSVGYQGDYTDPTTGLVNMGARWYQPSSGSFMSRDTFAGRLDSPVTLNRYTYANNNPLTMFDPTGHYSEDRDARVAAAARARQDGREHVGMNAQPVHWNHYTDPGEDARDRRAVQAQQAAARQRRDPGEDARDRRAAEQQATNYMRNACIARGDRCKTAYDDMDRFHAIAQATAISVGGYIPLAAKYAPVPPLPPPPPSCGVYCNVGPGSDMPVPVYDNDAAVARLQGADAATFIHLLDVSYGGVGETPDGNIGLADIKAAAFGYNGVELISAMCPGCSQQQILADARVLQGVAKGLLQVDGSWEDFDQEQSWWERNGGTVMNVVGVASLALGVVSLGTCSLCVAAGVASLTMTVGTTAYACVNHENVSCALGALATVTGGASLALKGSALATGAAAETTNAAMWGQLADGHVVRAWALSYPANGLASASAWSSQASQISNVTSVGATATDVCAVHDSCHG